MVVIEARTLGDAWLALSGRILREGNDGAYEGLPMRELAVVTLAVAEPDENDLVIASLADPEWLEWMHANFTRPDDVA
jgi:hypothetical protein